MLIVRIVVSRTIFSPFVANPVLEKTTLAKYTGTIGDPMTHPVSYSPTEAAATEPVYFSHFTHTAYLVN
jgi:hypothetical protein